MRCLDPQREPCLSGGHTKINTFGLERNAVMGPELGLWGQRSEEVWVNFWGSSHGGSYMEAHTSQLNVWKAEAGGLLEVQDQLILHTI